MTLSELEAIITPFSAPAFARLMAFLDADSYISEYRAKIEKLRAEQAVANTDVEAQVQALQGQITEREAAKRTLVGA